MSPLQKVIADHELSPSLHFPGKPMPLPLCHVADSRDFGRYAEECSLRPSLCDVFEEEVLYLFYGGLFYRSFSRPTRKASLYPVGFLFASRVFSDVARLVPFDTGAVKSGFYEPSSPIVTKWRDCVIDTSIAPLDARTLVQYLFGTNKNYLRGYVSVAAAQLPDPFPWLIRHLSSDQTAGGCDQRQYRIECHSLKKLSFANLLWVGYPDIYASSFGKIFDQCGSVPPQRYSYDFYQAASPAEMTAVLQQEATRFTRERIDSSI